MLKLTTWEAAKSMRIDRLEEFLAEQLHALNAISAQNILQVAEVLKKTSNSNNRIWIAGNGGSATTAAHFAVDLSKGCFTKTQQRYLAICLNEGLGIQSAWANDESYEMSLSRSLETQANKGDCFIAISGSGNSTNILNAINKAQDMELRTVSFLGMGGGKSKGLSNYEIIINSQDMQIIENAHVYLVHAIYKILTSVN